MGTRQRVVGTVVKLHIEVDHASRATLEKVSKFFDFGPFGRPRLGKAVEVACQALEIVLEDPILRSEVLEKLLPQNPINKVASRNTESVFMVRPDGSRYDMDDPRADSE